MNNNKIKTKIHKKMFILQYLMQKLDDFDEKAGFMDLNKEDILKYKKYALKYRRKLNSKYNDLQKELDHMSEIDNIK